MKYPKYITNTLQIIYNNIKESQDTRKIVRMKKLSPCIEGILQGQDKTSGNTLAAIDYIERAIAYKIVPPNKTVLKAMFGLRPNKTPLQKILNVILANAYENLWQDVCHIELKLDVPDELNDAAYDILDLYCPHPSDGYCYIESVYVMTPAIIKKWNFNLLMNYSLDELVTSPI